MNTHIVDAPPAAPIHSVLGLRAGATSRRWPVRLLWVTALLIAIAVAVIVWRSRNAAPAVTYVTATAVRGALTVTVSATGSLGSLTQVDVGTEISGVVERVNVDFNSAVQVGQVLAQVNTDKLQAQAAEARASVEAAAAQLEQSKATVAEADSVLARFEQVRTLSGGRVPSQQELEAQRATVARARAAESNTRAQIVQAQARLAGIETDMKRAYIRSPITGIVLDRKIDPGQTVAAAFTTPVLFTLAEDLTRMKLTVNVDEADIGSVTVGQSATFRVDAYGDRRFDSTVSEIRSTPETADGVITYKTILTVDNSERLLRPGMTATAEIVVRHVDDALLVPNTALRFTPPATTAPPDEGFSLIRPPGGSPRQPPAKAATGDRRQVWVLVNSAPVPIDVVIGSTDGQSTEIVSGSLSAEAAVIVDIATGPVS